MISARKRPKNSEEFWPEGAGELAEMAPPCIPQGSVFMRLSLIKAVPRLSAGKSVNLVNHLHQDCANSMSENHCKLEKFGVSLAYYYDSIFTFRLCRINHWKLKGTLNSGQHRENVVTVLAVVFVNASQNKIHLLDFQIQETRIIYLCEGSNWLPSMSFPKMLILMEWNYKSLTRGPWLPEQYQSFVNSSTI